MKKVFMFVMFLFLLGVADAEAHSGRTDANGGHNCSEKSIAKGLCTGYHYHNGGSSNPPQNKVVQPVKQQAPASRDKDCGDFSSYDEMIAYWNDQGYSATYDPENLDGWGNVVDDGIPCEAPSNYDLTKINNSPQQVSKKEREAGHLAGEKAGYAAGYNNEDKKTETTGSVAFQEGYASAYVSAYLNGQAKLEEEIEVVYDSGYASGQANEKLVVPTELNAQKSEAFKRGHSEGYRAYVATQVPVYQEKGKNDGIKDTYNVPNVSQKAWLDAYEAGYKEGQQQLEEQYKNQGYEAAFTMPIYTHPDLGNEKYDDWYEQGFVSNELVKEIETVAYEQGKSGNDMEIANKYMQGQLIYEHYYEKGREEYVNPTPFVAGGVFALGGGYMIYRRNRKKKKTLLK